MNKEKIKEYAIQRFDKLCKEHDKAESYVNPDPEEMAWFSARLEEIRMLKQFIQSEPKEKTNFDLITESPEELADYFYDVNKLYAESLGMDMKQSKEDGVEEFLKWLNQKAGE